MQTPILQTERLILRPLKIADAEEAFNSWTGDPEVAKYMRWSVHESVNDTIDHWLSGADEASQSDKTYDWGIIYKQTGEIVGSGGVHYNADEDIFEIGYGLAKRYWGRGIATEAAQEFVRFVKGELNLANLCGKHAIENVASGKILQKLGFKYIGDGTYDSFDGLRTFNCKEYILDLTNLPKEG